MAKISARGAKEVCRVKAKLRNNTTIEHATHEFVLRSDGAILRKATYPGARGNYKVWRNLKSDVSRTRATLGTVLSTNGWMIVDG